MPTHTPPNTPESPKSAAHRAIEEKALQNEIDDKKEYIRLLRRQCDENQVVISKHMADIAELERAATRQMQVLNGVNRQPSVLEHRARILVEKEIELVHLRKEYNELRSEKQDV